MELIFDRIFIFVLCIGLFALGNYIDNLWRRINFLEAEGVSGVLPDGQKYHVDEYNLVLCYQHLEQKIYLKHFNKPKKLKIWVFEKYDGWEGFEDVGIDHSYYDQVLDLKLTCFDYKTLRIKITDGVWHV